MRNLEPHLRYAYSHLYERTLTEVVRDDKYEIQPLDEETESKARADTKQKITIPTSTVGKIPNGTPGLPNSLKSVTFEDDKKGDQSSDSDNSSYTDRRGTMTEDHDISSIRSSMTLTNAEDYRMSISESSNPDEYFDAIDTVLIYDEVVITFINLTMIGIETYNEY